MRFHWYFIAAAYCPIIASQLEPIAATSAPADDEIEAFLITLFQRRNGNSSCEFAVFMRRFRNEFADPGYFRMTELSRVTDRMAEVSGSEKIMSIPGSR